MLVDQRQVIGLLPTWVFRFAAIGLIVECTNFKSQDFTTKSSDQSSQAGLQTTASEGETKMLTISSTVFTNYGEIPIKYTSQGKNVSPPLSWEGVPPTAKSLVLIVDDPDAPDPAAPQRVWVHWLIYNLPPHVSALGEGIHRLPNGAKLGKNDWNKAEYGGPSPPIGRHRYFFKIYALDTLLSLESPTKSELEHAMKGHILAHAELVGTYQKP